MEKINTDTETKLNALIGILLNCGSELQRKFPHNQYCPEENQKSSVNVIPESVTGFERQDGNSTLYFDDETNLLWFSAEKKTSLEPKDADVLKAIIDVLLKKNRCCCRKEEILQKVYEVEVGPQQKLPEESEYLNAAVSTINGKCKKELGMKDKLIEPDGKRWIKLSRNLENRKL